MREDWVECTFEDVIENISTSNYKIKQKDYTSNGEIPVVDQGQELIGGYFNNKENIIPVELPVVVFGDHTKCVKYINFHFVPGADGTKVLKVDDNISTKYIYYLLKVLVFKIEDKGYARHFQFLQKELIPLPPLPEQRAIVKKIEALFSSLDAGIADLKKAQDQLKIYRQAVLKKAFEGELTKEWREKQTDLPTAEELLLQIEEQRQAYYEKQIEDWKNAVAIWEKNGKDGKKPTKPSKPKKLDIPDFSEIQEYNLNENLNWNRLGNLTLKIGDVDHKMPKQVANGIPYLSTSNILANGDIDFDNAKLISENDYLNLSVKIKPEVGDIIFPRYGTIGRNVIVKDNRKFLVSYSCAIIKVASSILDSKFLLYYTLSPVIKREIQRYIVETTQANIGIASIERFFLPIYSLQEQAQIVKEIESRLSVCDAVEQQIKDSLSQAEALRQSILKKAFEGKLLTEEEIKACQQEPDYEPAAVLLEKIKAEKEANKPVKKTKKK
ncbi:restriction endonuclease subunit S [Empedobacter falsenii]